MALAQKVRLEEKYTPENIATLFEITFETTPREEEVTTFIASVKEAFKGADESVVRTAELCEDFDARFEPLISGLNEEPSSFDRALFKETIMTMNGERKVLQEYAAHVEDEVKKLSVNEL